MPNTYFQFKQFTIDQSLSGMKVTTDACLFGAWVANELESRSVPADVILDIGGGTGLLSLMLAQKCPASQIHAVEIHKRAHLELTQNFKKSPWTERLLDHQGAVQQFQQEKSFDVIVSNPPFFEGSLKGADAAKNLAVHSDSLDQNTIVSSVSRLLSPAGSFYVLYPEREMAQLMDLAKESALDLVKWVTVRNKAGANSFRVMAQFKLGLTSSPEVEESELVIKRADGRYTDKFWRLLADYYLEYNKPHQNKE